MSAPTRSLCCLAACQTRRSSNRYTPTHHRLARRMPTNYNGIAPPGESAREGLRTKDQGPKTKDQGPRTDQGPGTDQGPRPKDQGLLPRHTLGPRLNLPLEHVERHRALTKDDV